MDFVGTGLKIQPADIARAAVKLSCEEAMVKAVLAVEARGSGWDNRNRPVILFEPHVFWRNLPAARRPAAQSANLAWPAWRPGKYPSRSDERYEQVARAMEIDRDAALKSASWGIGQVLGENHAVAGFATVLEMVTACMESEGRQLDCMVGFMVSHGLARAMRARDYRTIARIYNGSGYAKHGYHTRIETAYLRISAEQPAEYDPLSDGLLMMGDKGDAVKSLQIELQAEGYRIVADGDFGKITEQSVRAFQRSRGLHQDGKVGAATGRALGLTFWG